MSPAQLMRKTIHYVACGVLPLTHAVPTRSMFHNLLIDEALDGIPQHSPSTTTSSIPTQRVRPACGPSVARADVPGLDTALEEQWNDRALVGKHIKAVAIILWAG